MTNINDHLADERRGDDDAERPAGGRSTLDAGPDVMSTIASRRAAPATHSGHPHQERRDHGEESALDCGRRGSVALITMRFVGYPPVEKGTEATIGAAQRYQSPQISSADVKTQDAQLQAFLQSDLFHQLSTDKAARQALKNKDFQRALADAAVRAALARPTFGTQSPRSALRIAARSRTR